MPVGTRIRGNNAQGAISDNPLLVGATTMNSAGLANLPTVTAGNHAVIILDPLRTAGAPEIIIVTAHSAAATSATVTRGAYGTTARQHASGVAWVHAPTIDDVVQVLTSVTRPSDPYRGQLIFETDTNSFVARDTSDAWQTAVPLGAWAAWTPTWTQSATITKTITRATYTRFGRMITAYFNLTATSAGTAANAVNISNLPVAAATGAPIVGSWWYLDAGTTVYVGSTHGISTTSVEFTVSGNANPFGVTPGLTIASGDVFQATVTYEAA